MVKKHLISTMLDSDERLDFRKVRPAWNIRYTAVLTDILVIWVMILVGFVPFYLLRDNTLWSVIAILPGAMYFSYWKHAYVAFFHEAAHFNLHENKDTNDRLANLFWTPINGMRIKSYRKHHLQHHAHLGDSGDTEISYVTPLNLKNILASVTGVYMVKTVFRYLMVARRGSMKADPPAGDTSGNALDFFLGLAVMGICQLSILAGLYFGISVYAAICWVISVFITDMFVANLRQTLEHRDAAYGGKDDFSDRPHGEINKMFGTGFFARFFGGAGFNRHLLHHLDASVSYTRFDEMEAYLLGTSAAPYLNDNRTTYWRRIRELVLL